MAYPDPSLRGVDLPVVTVPAGTRLFRVHSAARDPLWFGPAPGADPQNRFDAPGGEFRVCYLGMSREASFAETFLRNPPVRLLSFQLLETRSLATIGLRRDLRLVSLHGPALARVGTTLEASSGPYPLSRAWSLAFWAHPAAADGIQYRSRHDDSQLCVALFDRARDTLEVLSAERITTDIDFLGALSRRYGFGLTR